MVKSVRELEVYQRAYKLALDLHKMSLDFPKEEQFALANQIRRASKSICANLAEGFAKNFKSPTEFKRYSLIALGSAEEMLVWLDFCKDLNYIDAIKWQKIKEEYEVICKQLYTMIDRWKD